MCKAHTEKVIDEITKCLNAHKPCRLISTSCIEAGVDLDFEKMYRAFAPLDSVIQCAGRCNRNGKGDGKMVVFIPDEEKLYPSDDYRNRANCVKVISCRHEIDINNPAHIEEYYSELFTQFNKDKAKLCNAIEDYDFEEVEKQYRFIPSKGASVLVPYKDELKLFKELAEEAVTKGITKSWIKRAASITVTSYRTDKLEEICEKSAPLRTADGIYMSPVGWYILNDSGFYDDLMGLHFDDDSSLNYLI
jgi:CRISPR/Cas system-associated endonuclease/helicase Cas3